MADEEETGDAGDGEGDESDLKKMDSKECTIDDQIMMESEYVPTDTLLVTLLIDLVAIVWWAVTLLLAFWMHIAINLYKFWNVPELQCRKKELLIALLVFGSAVIAISYLGCPVPEGKGPCNK